MRVFLFIGHPLAGCTCFGTPDRSINTPLAFLCVFAALLATLYLVVCVFALLVAQEALFLRFCWFIGHPVSGCTCFCTSICSISTPLAFLCVFAVLLDTFCLVVHVLALLRAQ